VRRWLAFAEEMARFRARPPYRGVAYLVSGWSNDEALLPPGEVNVYRWLGEHGIEVRLCWWNSVHPAAGETPGPIPEPFTDHGFVRRLTRELTQPELNGKRVVLIGHSFGASSLLEVANEVAKSKTNPRRIDFLGVLDPTGPFGLRRLARRNAVPPNVAVFWNRWQGDSIFPFDFFTTGRIKVKDTSATQQDQSRARTVRGLGAHQLIFESAEVQRELLHALDAASAAW
jgi:pimeloyl-ACP methyl ester carboxylesterase